MKNVSMVLGMLLVVGTAALGIVAVVAGVFYLIAHGL